MNFGKDVSTLKYFTICGLQEGYEPFAVNMNRDVTMWLSKRLPQFVPVPPNHQHIEVRTTRDSQGQQVSEVLNKSVRPVVGHMSICSSPPCPPQVLRVDGTVELCPCLKVTQRSFGSQNSHNDLTFYRLSMPIECAESYSRTRTNGGLFSPKRVSTVK